MRTNEVRKAKQPIIVTPKVRAILTMVHRRSSRCSRNGLEVSLSGSSRNLKMSRSAIRLRSCAWKRKESAGGKSSAHTQSVPIADVILCDHVREFLNAEGTTFNDAFTFLRSVHRRGANRLSQKEVAMFIRETGR